MNIELANRLYEYRKQSGLSQEELAEKLGISRQSVSKWERAESCPDTDNLIELAKIYNVSLDELVHNNVNEKQIKKEKVEEASYSIKINIEDNDFEDNFDNGLILKEDGIHFYNNGDNGVVINKNGIHINKEQSKEEIIPYEEVYTEIDGKETRIVDIEGFGKNKKFPSENIIKFKDVFNGVLILIIAALYVSLCALKLTDWGKFWVIFVYYPAITSLLEAIVYKDANKFATPVLCAAVYVTIGMYFDVWHPYWFIFFIIPIYHTIANAFKKKIKLYFYGKDNEKHTFNIFEGAIQVTHKK